MNSKGADMTTVIPQNELTRRAIDWICEKCGATPSPEKLSPLIEEAAMRFNLGPLEVEFLGRFYANEAAGEK
jgi:hypothetical protein